jgi:thioredoxin-related protein
MSIRGIRATLGCLVAVAGLFVFDAWMPQSAGGEPADDAAKLAKLIEQLDSPSFREREQAQRTLVDLPGLWAKRLKQSRSVAKSPEVRGRLDHVIEQRCRGAWKIDMAQAMATAQRESKLVMVFSTRGSRNGYSCMGANLMRRATFSDERLVQDLRHQVVAVWHDQNSVLVNCKLQPPQKPPTKQMIKAYPVGGGGGNLRTYFCTPAGKIVHYVEGYWPATAFAAELRYAQTQYAAMQQSSETEIAKTLAANLGEQIAAIETQRQALMKRHPAEFKKPFAQSEIRRRHASLGLKVNHYRAAAKLASKDVSPVLAQLMIQHIGRGAFI